MCLDDIVWRQAGIGSERQEQGFIMEQNREGSLKHLARFGIGTDLVWRKAGFGEKPLKLFRLAEKKRQSLQGDRLGLLPARIAGEMLDHRIELARTRPFLSVSMLT